MLSTGVEAATLASEADMDDPEDFQASQSESDDEATMIEEEVQPLLQTLQMILG